MFYYSVVCLFQQNLNKWMIPASDKTMLLDISFEIPYISTVFVCGWQNLNKGIPAPDETILFLDNTCEIDPFSDSVCLL